MFCRSECPCVSHADWCLQSNATYCARLSTPITSCSNYRSMAQSSTPPRGSAMALRSRPRIPPGCTRQCLLGQLPPSLRCAHLCHRRRVPPVPRLQTLSRFLTDSMHVTLFGVVVSELGLTPRYQALQGVFFPADQASWRPPYIAFPGNPVTRAGPPPAGNTYAKGGAENCEFAAGPDGQFHAVCASHGALYPGTGLGCGRGGWGGGRRVHPCFASWPETRVASILGMGLASRSTDSGSTDSGRCRCALCNPRPCLFYFVVCGMASHRWLRPALPGHRAARPGPRSALAVRWLCVHEGVPGDAATVRYFVAKRAGGVALYSVAWSPVHEPSRAADP